MVDATLLLWLAAVGLAVAFLAAIGSRGLRDFSRHQLQAICEERQKLDRFGEIVRDHDQAAFGAETLLSLGLAVYFAAGTLWAWGRFGSDVIVWLEIAAVVAALGAIAAFLVVVLPRAFVAAGAERFLYACWPLWKLVGRILTPLAWVAAGIEMVIRRLTGRTSPETDEDSFEEEIRSIVTEGHREGLLEEDAREMIEGVIELGDVVVSHIMTPRTDMQMIHVELPWNEMVEYVMTVRHARFPVYNKSRDDIIGMLFIKDLLPELVKPAEGRRPLTELLRKALFVPESKAVNDVLQLFQLSRTHMAIVLDEYGGVSGLVTIEDVLEEIVGEIEDEFDPEAEEDITKLDDDRCETLGRAHVDQINAVMDFDLPENAAFDTIGGFVFAEFGRVPHVGESLKWNDSVQVTVLEASRRRVGRVRLERIHQEAAELA